MPKYQTTDVTGEFAYQFVYTEDADGWGLESLAIQRSGTSILSKHFLPGRYRTEAITIAYGIQLCETVVRHLTYSPALDREVN